VSSILVRLAGVERDAEALQRALELIDQAEATLPDTPDAGALAALLNTRGSTWLELGDGIKAEADYRKSLDLRRTAGDRRTGVMWFSQAQVGSTLSLQGRFAEAHRLQSEAASELRELLGPDAYQNALIAVRRAQTFGAEKDFRNAALQWREGVRLLEKTYGVDHPYHFDWSLELVKSLAEIGDAEAASLADVLLARWAGKSVVGQDYAELAVLRCRLHEKAGARDAARAVAVATLALPKLDASVEERGALEAFARTE
jgi:tetratricopeptide (TPR) repeat protein